MNTVAIILARGGSKGIPGKNIIDFCGKPLMAWTIEQLQSVHRIDSIWLSSDSEEILATGSKYDVEVIRRPEEIAGDEATSESAWLHALDVIESRRGQTVDTIVAPQVTSPLRESVDIERGIEDFTRGRYDSLFSCCPAEDLFFWKKSADGKLDSVNYNYKNRTRRQDTPEQYIENGSFYIFKPEILRSDQNRLGGVIGMTEMAFWKSFEIDSMEDLKICEALMFSFLLNKNV